MIGPSAMVGALYEVLASGRFNRDIAATLANVSASIAAAMLVGVALGTALQGLGAVRRVLDPLFATWSAIPIYAFYPLLIVILGLGELPQIAIGFLLAVMAVILNTLNGLDRVPPVLLKAARSHRLGALATAFKVRLPCAAPYLFAGFRLAAPYSFIPLLRPQSTPPPPPTPSPTPPP